MKDWYIMSKRNSAVEAIRTIITMTANHSILYRHKKTFPPTELELLESLKISGGLSSE